MQSDAWKLFRCKLDFTSLCYLILSQLEALLLTLAEYFVWLCTGIVGTAALVVWKQDFLRVCDNGASVRSDTVEEVPSLVQQLLRNVLPIRATVWNPTAEAADQSAFVARAVERELGWLRNASDRAWQNQTGEGQRPWGGYLPALVSGSYSTHRSTSVCGCGAATLEQLQRQQTTLAALTRVYDDCAVAEDQLATSDADSFVALDLCDSADDPTSSVDPLRPFSSLPTALVASSTSSSWNVSFDRCFQGNDTRLQTTTGTHPVLELHHRQACAAEQGLYLAVASWWLLCVLWATSRVVAKLLVKASAMLGWRVLSASRLEFVGFCFEDGAVHACETLATAVRKHLRDARWLAMLRLLIATLALGVCACVWQLVLQRTLQ